MNLAEFIESALPQILAEWEQLARALIPESDGLDFDALKVDAGRILDLIARDLDVVPSRFPEDAIVLTLPQRIAQIQALRTSVLRLYGETRCVGDLEELTRFNEALDQALVDAEPHPADADVPLVTRTISLGGGAPRH